MKIRAAVLRRSGLPRPFAKSCPLSIEEVDLDEPKAGEVLVKIHAAGLCHSDLVAIDPIKPPVQVFDAGAPAPAVDVGPAKPRPDAGRSKPKRRPDTGVHARVAKPPKALGRGWMVQLIATGDAAEAGKVERQARGLGYTTEIVLEEVPDGSRSLYKVRVGPFTDKAGGAEARRRIKSKLGIRGWLHRSR